MRRSKVKFNASGMRQLEQQVVQHPEYRRQAAVVNQAATAAVLAVARDSGGTGDVATVLARLEAAVKQIGADPNRARLAQIAEDIVARCPEGVE